MKTIKKFKEMGRKEKVSFIIKWICRSLLLAICLVLGLGIIINSLSKNSEEASADTQSNEMIDIVRSYAGVKDVYQLPSSSQAQSFKDDIIYNVAAGIVSVNKEVPLHIKLKENITVSEKLELISLYNKFTVFASAGSYTISNGHGSKTGNAIQKDGRIRMPTADLDEIIGEANGGDEINGYYKIEAERFQYTLPKSWMSEELKGQVGITISNVAQNLNYQNGVENYSTAFYLGEDNSINFGFFGDLTKNENLEDLTLRYYPNKKVAGVSWIINSEYGQMLVNAIIRNVKGISLGAGNFLYNYPEVGGVIDGTLTSATITTNNVKLDYRTSLYQRSIATNEFYYNQGYNSGYTEGYNDGYIKGGSGNFNPIGMIIEPAAKLLDTKLFGDFSIGMFFTAALFIALAVAFLKMFAGG